VSKLGFDYVVRRDIQNNPIVRELDKARQRELWRSAAVGVFLVFVLLFSAWQHFELLQLGYRIEQKQQERARELEINRHLKLEIETLQAPDRIERIATEQLHLVAPGSDEAIVLQPVVPAAAPDRSLVAAR
jgi:cell division protein FtsL